VGDRFLNARTQPYDLQPNAFEASMNGTHDAIDLIPTKDIIICDWHYGRYEQDYHCSYPSVKRFLEKGFRVWPAGCVGWRTLGISASMP